MLRVIAVYYFHFYMFLHLFLYSLTFFVCVLGMLVCYRVRVESRGHLGGIGASFLLLCRFQGLHSGLQAWTQCLYFQGHLISPSLMSKMCAP